MFDQNISIKTVENIKQLSKRHTNELFQKEQEPFGTNTVAVCVIKQKTFKFVFAADYTL